MRLEGDRGTHDGTGHGDCDKPFRYNRPQPTPDRPFPFTPHQLVKLLVVRSEYLEEQLAEKLYLRAQLERLLDY